MGAERVKKCSPFRRAKSFEKLVDGNPTFAVGRKQKKAFFQAVDVLRAFRRGYREALKLWRSGVRDVAFPHGTWMMGWAHQVEVLDDT